MLKYALILFCFSASSVSAQQVDTLYVNSVDGSTIKINVNQIAKIMFDSVGPSNVDFSNVENDSSRCSISSSITAKEVDIQFKSPDVSRVSVSVYSASGSLVYERETKADKGTNSVTWNTRDRFGDAVSSGLYFIVVRSQLWECSTLKFIIRR
jgi:flagellar hook assembly protein FlgD